MRRIDLRGQRPDDYRDVVPRADFDIEAAVPAVHAICEAVRTLGLEAILELSQQYDGVSQTDIRVPPQKLQQALAHLDPDIRAGLEESVRRGLVVEADGDEGHVPWTGTFRILR